MYKAINARKIAFNRHRGMCYKGMDLFSYITRIVQQIESQPFSMHQDTAVIAAWLHKSFDPRNVVPKKQVMKMIEIETHFGKQIAAILSSFQNRPTAAHGSVAEAKWIATLSPAAKLLLNAQNAVEAEFERQKVGSKNVSKPTNGARTIE